MFFLPIAVIAIAIMLKWFRDFARLVRPEYDQAIERTHQQYLLECRDMLNRIYFQSEMEDKYRE
ncbi:hypothetical protein [Phormidium tenue]|uniref:Uncharacterized protein n=1 Tax=Phormidium tenue FACHB-1050 TaxID=2692857 RepID=A0ABR8C7F3_9CYAN|nr:hypothetical protein [Phormidium tenue]MBD2316692.1 hypothetical protein [Phormidium tenue FACHB-1050]